MFGGLHMPPPYLSRKLESGDVSPATRERETGAVGRQDTERK